MKSLKLDHTFAQQVLSGERSSTWRVNDDKDLHVNDQVTLLDKVDPSDPQTWRPIGIARITTILEKQLGTVTKADMEGGAQYASAGDAIKTFQGYYGIQVGTETPVKIIRFTFIPEQSNGNTVPLTKKATLFADGGSRGNPGPSASGFVIYGENDQIIAENGLFLGVTTNNQAEYQALKIGMEQAVKLGVTEINIFMDSLLVINHMKNIFKVKNQDLLAIHQSVLDLATKFKQVSYNHVPRERNRRADSIVNKVLDSVK